MAKNMSVASKMSQALNLLRQGHDVSLQSIGLELVTGVRMSIFKWLTPAATDPRRAHVDRSMSCASLLKGKDGLFWW